MEIYSIPGLASKFNKLQEATVSMILLRRESTYGMKKADVDGLVVFHTEWKPLYAVSMHPMTKCVEMTSVRDEYQLLYMPALSLVFDTFLVNNPKMPAADKKAAGIHPLKGNPNNPTPVPNSSTTKL